MLACGRCPDLRAYCAEVGRNKRKAFEDWEYHARPVPGFGGEGAWLWVLGLAPAAHGANRTGRMFTGDRSGDFLYAGLHRAGLASQAESTAADDGLELRGVYISAAIRCAPPQNKPSAEHLFNCRSYLLEEWRMLKNIRVILALGGIAWDAALAAARGMGHPPPKPKPKFGHGAECAAGDRRLLGCYHVSQQNTFTGRLTDAMFDAILARARELAAT